MIDLAALRDEFSEHGCALMPGFLNSDELRELRTRTEDYLSKPAVTTKLETNQRFQGTLKNLNVDNSWFDNQLKFGKQAKLIADLLEDELEPATAAFFSRIPGETAAIDPHYDAIGHRRMGATIWIALDKSDRENGCLYYAQGTHKQVLEAKVGLSGFDENTEGVIPVELNPGDAAIHSSRTVHWSCPNKSDQPRRAISYFYWAASSKPSATK